MSGRIYLQNDDGSLRPLSEAAYAAEDVLQAELADHPDLLAGEQMNPAEPRRWLLVKQEAGIPDHEDGASRWHIDHVFLDQDAIPTFVEAKRKSDTRLRREVVGQALDYVSNAVAYWSDETLHNAFVAECEEREDDPGALLEAFVGDPGQVEEFWDLARTNLRAGRVRVVFVADALPAELRRIVEFLNDQTDPMEVLAVEVRRYEGQGVAALVPRVIGQTTEAQARKSASRRTRPWDRQSILRVLADGQGEMVSKAATEILDWAEERGLRLAYGSGAVTGSVFPMLDLANDEPAYTFSLRTNGRLEIEFQYFDRHAPYDSDEERLALRDQLSAIPGIEIPADGIDRFPGIDLLPLTDSAKMASFLRIWDEYISAVTAASEETKDGP